MAQLPHFRLIANLRLPYNGKSRSGFAVWHKWILTNETQPPTHFYAQKSERIQPKTGNSGHRWLGCILGVGQGSSLDFQHHVQAASRPFFAHKPTLCDQRGRVKDRFRFFDIVTTPVAMSGSGHHTVYQSDLRHRDVVFRPWQAMVHEWNMKVQTTVREHQVKLWHHRCLESYW